MNHPPKRRSLGNPSRHLRVVNMVAELQALRDPDGCQTILERLRGHYQPVGLMESALVQSFAYLSWCERGCWAMQMEIFKIMENDVPGDTDPGRTLVRGFMRGSSGPDLLTKLSRYEVMLDRATDECMDQLTRYANARGRKSADTAALAKLHPATSVIQ